jgi:uncharacterized membrane protein YhhN
VTSAAWALLVVAGMFAAADWWAVAGSRGRLDPTYTDRRAWFVAALVLSLAGDVFLMLPQDRFVPGLASFLLAHVAYTVGFDLHAGSGTALLVAAVGVVLVATVLGSWIVRALARGDHAALLGPVVAYMVVISAMLTSALAAGPWLGGAGAASFFASDALIAWDRFVAPRPWMPLAIIVTYHLGQAALVLALVR